MTETKRRIKALKQQLPHTKAKVAAMATSLLLAVVMLTSVSFAWYTMSSAPEVGSLKTTIAANGNLEVALAGRYDAEGKLLEPNKSTGKDSFATQGQVAGNLTWGNLINLSNQYGIEELVLRPATFDPESDAFLSSMSYSEDGRVNSTTNKFDFTYWTNTVGTEYAFVTTSAKQYGVRAISSVAYPEPDVEKKLKPARTYFEAAKAGYNDIVNNGDDIDTIESLINTYIAANVSSFVQNQGSSGGAVDADISNTDRNELYTILTKLLKNAFNNYGEALAAIANAQMALQRAQYQPYTWESLRYASPEELQNNGVSLGTLADFRNAYNELDADVTTMKGYVESAKSIKWSNIEDIIDNLIEISSVQIMVSTDGQILSTGGFTIGDLTTKFGYQSLLDYASVLNKMNVVPVRINGGSLCDFEEWTGTYMYAGMNVQAKYIVTIIDIKNDRAKLYTKWRNAGQEARFYGEEAETIRIAEEIAGGSVEYDGEKQALDTYGMVIDLWVRTNAADSILTLDGLIETVKVEALREIYISGSANAVQAFQYTYKTGEKIQQGDIEIEETETVQMFLSAGDVNNDDKISSYDYTVMVNGKSVTIKISEGYFYSTSTYDRVCLRDDEGEPVVVLDNEGNPLLSENGNVVYEYLTHEYFLDKLAVIGVEKYTYEVVTGFKASNRVDDAYTSEADRRNEISATQGSGSCYIFYASPENADSTLELLSHMKLAFCDINGNKLADARLAVEYVYADSGKYIVPIVVVPSDYAYVDNNGDVCYGITTLTKNEAKLISVVVYLEGEGLENSMVMENGSIQGSLNIQFSSNAELNSNDSEVLSESTIAVGAEIGNQQTTMELDFDPEDLSKTTVTLKAQVDGIRPNTVQAIFQRQVNASQGSAMKPIILDENLSASVTFKTPGIYMLRSLWVDGVEYDLPESSWITVTVKGFAISNVTFCEDDADKLALTANTAVTRPIDVYFSKGEQVTSVKVRFLDENRKTVDATLYSTTDGKWSGNVQFRASGHYTLTYVIVNGEAYELPEGMQKNFSAYLGLRAEVSLQSSSEGQGLHFPFRGETSFRVFARILTDTGEELKNQTGLVLSYAKRGSSLLQNGLESPLTWDNASSYYTGTFNVKGPGVYNFAKLSVGKNTITSYSRAATISAYAIEPPTYELMRNPLWDNATNNQTSDLLILSETDAVPNPPIARSGYYKVKLYNASGANDFTAVFKDANGTQYLVTVGDEQTAEITYIDASGQQVTYHYDPDGSIEDADDAGAIIVYFKIPQREGGASNGVWRLTEIRVTGVMDKEGNSYGSDEDAVALWYTLKKESGDLATFTVLENVSVTTMTSLTLGSSLTNAAEFMTAQPLVTGSGDNKQYLSLVLATNNITLSEHNLEVSRVVITLKNRGDTKTYGGYSSTSGKTGYETLAIEMEYRNGRWYVPESAVAYLAGTYSYSLRVTVDMIDDAADGKNDFVDQTFTIDGSNTVALTVWSKMPTVKITGGSYASTTSQTAATPNSTGTEISVHHYTSGTEVCGVGLTTNYNHPLVKIKLEGYGGASEAKLVFTSTKSAVLMYLDTYKNKANSNTPKTDNYSWTGNGEITRYIGMCEQIDNRSDTMELAGTLTATTLTMTFKNGTDTAVFTVDIPDIKIINE